MKKITLFLACLAAFAMVFGFTITSAMADTDLYGSVRFRTYWVDKDKDFSGTGYSDEDLDWRIGYLSRWGVNYQSGDVRGKLELDTRDGDQDEGSAELGDIRVRHFYGEWDFGAGKLLIGQTFNPYTFYNSGFGYYSGGLQRFGGMGLDYFRTSQIRLTFGNFVLAFMTPDTGTDPGGTAGLIADTDTTIPRIEARYTLKLDPVTLDFVGGYQTYDVVDANDDDESVDSYVAGINAKANFGPAYVTAAATYRQNGDQYGVWTVVDESAVWENNDMCDAEAWGLQLTLGYKISDTIKVEAAYSQVQAENDDQALKNEDDARAYGLLCNIKLAPGVSVQPELIFQDEQDRYDNGVKTEEGDATIFGVFWMINFK
jgi:hypothetical protein